jgi:hypothetical protein
MRPLMPPPCLAAAAATLAVASLSGCATESYFASAPPVRGPAERSETPSSDAARRLPMFSGRGTALGWRDVMDAVAWADVIILGEQHDDAIGHAVQLAVVEDAVARWPQVVVTMEMLERDEQPLVEDYFDGIIDADEFARLTFSESWAGKGSWAEWYQPIIDAAKARGGRVVAANAPRRYVKLARREGYARLDGLPPDRRRWVARPPALVLGGDDAARAPGRNARGDAGEGARGDAGWYAAPEDRRARCAGPARAPASHGPSGRGDGSRARDAAGASGARRASRRDDRRRRAGGSKGGHCR